MTYQETVREVFARAVAVREPRSVGGGYTVLDNNGQRLAWAPRAVDAWELAAGSMAVKRAHRSTSEGCDHYVIQGAW